MMKSNEAKVDSKSAIIGTEHFLAIAVKSTWHHARQLTTLLIQDSMIQVAPLAILSTVRDMGYKFKLTIAISHLNVLKKFILLF